METRSQTKPMQVKLGVAPDGRTFYCCPECPMSYPEAELLGNHFIRHKILNRFICDICGAAMRQPMVLKRHKLEHFEPNFMCSFCSKSFTRQDKLKQHCLVHTDSKIQCEECGNYYKSHYMKTHLQKHLRDKDKGKENSGMEQEVEVNPNKV